MENRLLLRRKVKPDKLSREELGSAIGDIKDILNKMSWKQRIRYLLLQKYGFRCRFCSNADYRVLQLDHIKGGGTQERKRNNHNVSKIYKMILDGLLPTENYQLLCANCNCLKKYDKEEV